MCLLFSSNFSSFGFLYSLLGGFFLQSSFFLCFSCKSDSLSFLSSLYLFLSSFCLSEEGSLGGLLVLEFLNGSLNLKVHSHGDSLGFSLLGYSSSGCLLFKSLLLGSLSGSLGNLVISGLESDKLGSSFLRSNSLKFDFSIKGSLL